MTKTASDTKGHLTSCVDDIETPSLQARINELEQALAVSENAVKTLAQQVQDTARQRDALATLLNKRSQELYETTVELETVKATT